MISLNSTLAASRGMMIEPARAVAFYRRAEALTQPQNSNLLQLLMAQEAPKMQVVGKTAIIPLQGVISYGISPIDRALGMTDINDFTANLQQAEANPDVSNILLNVDSPGGYTRGIEEAAMLVRNSTKRIEAFGVNINSAAIWIAGQANKVWGIASGDYGSIGSVAVVEDYSKAYENAGIKVHVISSGWAKGSFTPGSTITDEHIAFLQADITENANTFKTQLKQVRTTIPDEAMNGQWYSGRKAASLGIITGLVSSIDEVIASMNR